MAEFELAFQKLMKDEGVVLTNHKKDRGGLTYAGISRKYHPKWKGWNWIDGDDTPPIQMVRDFYFEKYWFPIKGDQIKDQKVAEVLFSQFVNMGEVGIKLAQGVIGVIQDGKIGPKTLAALNDFDSDRFLDKYALAMIARYWSIGMKDKSQRTWWPGWFSRALRIPA